MGESKEYMTLPEENGSINISEEVIAAIAVGAVREFLSHSGLPETVTFVCLLPEVKAAFDRALQES